MRSFAVVCEADADRRIACGLADRVFSMEIDWLEDHLLDSNRNWRGEHTWEPFLPWNQVPKRAQQRRIQAFGHFQGEPGAIDAYVARQALLLLKGSESRPDAVLLIRDQDDQPERLRGLEQARDLIPELPVVIGFAVTKRECWALAGFEPSSDREFACLEQLRQELGGDPRVGSHELTAKHDQDRRSAKRVLGLLCQDDADRESRCWEETDLAVLSDRGRVNGLANYLKEVSERLVCLLRRSPEDRAS